uniref:Uncharacterized protein n=1 Tax=Arundo donax TaxID=35708 RepID=A0A0A9BPM2_ARUDO
MATSRIIHFMSRVLV